MAGTPIGKIDCDISATHASGSQEQFKNLYDFFEQMVTAGYATRIALQYGAGVAPIGTGVDYWDDAAPFGENAFALYRMNGLTSGNVASDRDGVTLPDFDYYVLIQWADAVNFGISPGDPGLVDNGVSNGVAIAVAVRDDGGSPWNGTTNNDGTDSKGAIVWTGGVSTVHVFPTANELAAGSTVTTKENMRKWIDLLGSGGRSHMIGDADSFVLLTDDTDDGSYTVSYFGVYYPTTGLTPSLPLVCLAPNQNNEWQDFHSNVWGTQDCTGLYEGGVIGTHLSDGMWWVTTGLGLAGVLEDVVQPNTQPATPELDAVPVRVALSAYGPIGAAAGNPRSGYVGNLDTNLIQVVDNIASEQTNAALTRAFFGSLVTANMKHSVPWDGVTTPGSTLTRAGVTF